MFVMDSYFNCSNKLFKVCVMDVRISVLLLFDLLWGANECDLVWDCDVVWDYFGGGDNP